MDPNSAGFRGAAGAFAGFVAAFILLLWRPDPELAAAFTAMWMGGYRLGEMGIDMYRRAPGATQ